MNTDARTAGGLVSVYGFACGLVESAYHGRVNVTLWREHGCYHVRAHDHENSRRLFWDSFRTLGEARRRFREAGSKLYTIEQARP